jgi:hypothetical protein
MLLPDATLVWEQWKYRHKFFWSAFYAVVVTTAVIGTVPLFKPDVLTQLRWVSLGFPAIAFGFGSFGLGLLDAEYKRLGAVGDSFVGSPWSWGAPRNPPYRTDVGPPLGRMLTPALRAGLLGIPVAAALTIVFALVK